MSNVQVGEKLPIDGVSYQVTHVFGPNRALISYDGLMVLVDYSPTYGTWDLSGQPATADENKVIQGLMPDVDTTGLVITKD